MAIPKPNHGPLVAPIAFSAVGIVYELLCLSLTLVKTWGYYRLGLATGLKSPLSVLLLRDGERMSRHRIEYSLQQGIRIAIFCVRRTFYLSIVVRRSP